MKPDTIKILISIVTICQLASCCVKEENGNLNNKCYANGTCLGSLRCIDGVCKKSEDLSVLDAAGNRIDNNALNNDILSRDQLGNYESSIKDKEISCDLEIVDAKNKKQDINSPDKPCMPNCAGKNCGPDGCGNTCGVCSGSCSSKGICHKLACVLKSVACINDSDCTVPKKCRSHPNKMCGYQTICQTKKNVPGFICRHPKMCSNVCNTDKDCDSYQPYCESGICQQCRTDADCGGGTKCIDSSVFNSCNKDSDCAGPIGSYKCR